MAFTIEKEMDLVVVMRHGLMVAFTVEAGDFTSHNDDSFYGN